MLSFDLFPLWFHCKLHMCMFGKVYSYFSFIFSFLPLLNFIAANHGLSSVKAQVTRGASAETVGYTT